MRSAGLIVLAVALLAAAGILASRPLAYDFTAYWLAGRHLLDGAPLYPVASGAVFLGQGQFLYEPLVAVAFVPLAMLPFEPAAWVWTAGLIVTAVALGVALVRPFSTDARPWAGAAYALYLPLLAEITLGNLNLVTVALAFAVWSLRDRPRAAGALLTLVIALKLFPVVLLVFWAVARRWRLVRWTIAFGLAAILVSLPFLWARWIEYLGFVVSAITETSEFAINIVPPEIAGGPLRYVLPLAAIALAAYAGSRGSERARGLAHHVAVAVTPLVSPLAWYPYLVLAAPALAASAATAGPRLRVIVIASFVAMELPSGRPPLPYAAFLGLVGLVVVSVLMVREGTTAARRSRRDDASDRRTASSPSGRSGTA